MQFSLKSGSTIISFSVAGLCVLALASGCSRSRSSQNGADAPPVQTQEESKKDLPKDELAEEFNRTVNELTLVHSFNILRFGLPPSSNKALLPEVRAALGSAVNELTFLKTAFGPTESTDCQRFLNVYEGLHLELLKAFDKARSAPNDKVVQLVARSRIRAIHLFIVQLRLKVLDDNDGGEYGDPEPYYCKLGNRAQFKSLVERLDGQNGLTDRLIQHSYGIQGLQTASEEQVELQNYVASTTEWEQRKSIFVNTMEIGLSFIASGYLTAATAATKGAGFLAAMGQAMAKVMGLRFALFTSLSVVDVIGFKYLNHWLIPDDEFEDYTRIKEATGHFDYICGQSENFLIMNYNSPAAYAGILEKFLLEPWRKNAKLIMKENGKAYREYVKKYGSIQKAQEQLTNRAKELAQQLNLPLDEKSNRKLKSIVKQNT